MLDRRTGELLNVLNNMCPNGSYKVLTAAELIDSMPKKLDIDIDGLRESLKVLQEREFIRVKYEDDVEFCLCTLPKGRFLYESKTDELIEITKTKRTYFLYSFLGSFIGCAVFAGIAFLIYFFLLR